MAAANILHDAQQTKIHITTNLYELVKAVADESRPEEDSLVSRVVLELLKNCQARFDGYAAPKHALHLIIRDRY